MSSAGWAGPLWDCLERAAAAQPAAAARARQALAVVVEAAAAGEDAGAPWRSRLTGDGFPLELVFTSGGGSIRYTAEAGGPAGPPRSRLDAAVGLLGRLGAAAPGPEPLVALRAVQASGPLAFGAWIGGRHGASGDRYKIYAEVDATGAGAANALARRALGPVDLLPGAAAPLPRIVGYTPDSGGWEIYWRAQRLEAFRLGALLARAGLAARRGELAELIELAWGRPLREELPGACAGFSYALSSEGRPEAFSLFFPARSLWGDDRRIRERALALADAMGWALPGYREAAAPLDGRSGYRTRHGMLAFVVPAEGALSVHLGLRPPGEGPV